MLTRQFNSLDEKSLLVINNIGMAEMRHRRQHVIGAAALGRQRRVGDRRRVQVQGEIVGQLIAVEYLVDQFAISLAKQDGMVRDAFRDRLAQAEIGHEQRHGMPLFCQPRAIAGAAGMVAEEFLVGMDDICVAGDKIDIEQPAIVGLDPGHAVAICADLRHFGR